MYVIINEYNLSLQKELSLSQKNTAPLFTMAQNFSWRNVSKSTVMGVILGVFLFDNFYIYLPLHLRTESALNKCLAPNQEENLSFMLHQYHHEQTEAFLFPSFSPVHFYVNSY